MASSVLDADALTPFVFGMSRLPETVKVDPTMFRYGRGMAILRNQLYHRRLIVIGRIQSAGAILL